MSGPPISESNRMITKTTVIVNRAGLHARSSAKLAEVAAGFSSDVRIGVGARAVDGKSILSLMMLAATQGTTVSLEADGADESDAIAALVALFEDGFGESL